ncbi:MAG: DUF4296 domain-containing protein [Bacteroidales bacterium]|nr:DUF4296 domain-containing protein [Bacteroidales bacterium]
MDRLRSGRATGIVRRCLVIGLALALVSCGFFRAPGKDKCDKLLPREKMVDVLTDIYLLEAYIRDMQQFERRARDSARYYYMGIFDHHQVDVAIFEAAFDCYLLDKKEMDLIHEKMLNRLSIIESEMGWEEEKEEVMPALIPAADP